jgi:bifunctional non-homologous end joining protein LigD
MNESASLAFNDLAQGGSSDKVYLLTLEEEAHGWTVTCQYGRRGSALASQQKAVNVTYLAAKKVYDKILREKLSKGYSHTGQEAKAPVAPSGAAVDVLPPELLEEVINGDAAKYLADPAYWMQDKSDGVSRGVVKQKGEIFGLNKRGQPVPLPAELVEELAKIELETFQIDAELVGSKLVCRDLLIADVDVSQITYAGRFQLLTAIVHAAHVDLISLVKTWTDEEKAPAFVRQRQERREGVVFKLHSAPYRPGRNGQHKKYKFIKTLSAIAGKPGATGKESVELFLYDDKWSNHKLQLCGTVSLIGKPAVKEGDVVEVSYLYAQPSGLLSQARMQLVRTDVAPEECTTAQLIFKREEAE